MKEKSIMDVFGEAVEKDRTEVASMEKNMGAHVREKEKDLARVRDDLANERNLFSKMRDEYRVLEGGIEVEIQRGLEETEATKEKVQKGEVSLSEFMKTGLGEKELRAKARAGTRDKLAAAAELLRKKSARIYELEAQEADLVYDLAYCAFSVPSLYFEKFKKSAEDFQRLLNPVANGLMMAANANEKAKENLLHAENKHLYNIIWDSLTVPEIRELLFDSRIPENLLPQIESFLATADPAARYRGVYVAFENEAGTKPYIAFTDIGLPRVAGTIGRSRKIMTADLP